MQVLGFKKTFILFNLLFSLIAIAEISPEARAKGFVYLHEIDPTIMTSLRYFGSENFLGRPVAGYLSPVVIMTKPAAMALAKVQAELKKDGYSLVVYDAYRPQRAVDDFIFWSKDIADQTKKQNYYPRINKKDVFQLGYVAERSGHSRGSAIDLTIIKTHKKLHEVQVKKRQLQDGYEIAFLDDCTVDMGSSFDLFDTASHFENNLVSAEYKKLRTYLKNVMEKHGFKNYAEEWWHFILKNEPFPADHDDSYFDFVIE